MLDFSLNLGELSDGYSASESVGTTNISTSLYARSGKGKTYSKKMNGPEDHLSTVSNRILAILARDSDMSFNEASLDKCYPRVQEAHASVMAACRKTSKDNRKQQESSGQASFYSLRSLDHSEEDDHGVQKRILEQLSRLQEFQTDFQICFGGMNSRTKDDCLPHAARETSEFSCEFDVFIYGSTVDPTNPDPDGVRRITRKLTANNKLFDPINEDTVYLILVCSYNILAVCYGPMTMVMWLRKSCGKTDTDANNKKHRWSKNFDFSLYDQFPTQTRLRTNDLGGLALLIHDQAVEDEARALWKEQQLFDLYSAYASEESHKYRWGTEIHTLHQEYTRPLYMDVDALKQVGAAVMVYHVKGDPEPKMMDSNILEGFEDNKTNPTTWLKRAIDFQAKAIEPISLSLKCLSQALRNYSPNERSKSSSTMIWMRWTPHP
ncbi:hypothetical protein K504DRAFT_503325 [Pleomassaria siparia CBS 279.74]|uniref:Uncharacterized protein n=1 Tax=Pleomassaria siparia CBS 279.74 TaxID=1314801 RepID=A0A6G1K5P6_9PLEO|nr:hypothetical protein K504DRAFT_503325 [Pleomassaria siparia CBS 279.74]